MARSESRTKTAIWSDDDFCALTCEAQRVYWMLYSQPTISLCGVLALTVKRWASKAKDSTETGIVEALAELEEASFIVVDMDTEEVWIRSFVHHDGVTKSSKTRQAAFSQLGAIFSEKLRVLAQAALEDAPSTDGSPDTPSSEPEYPIPQSGIPYPDFPDTSSVRARAASVSSLQPPSPSSSLRLPADVAPAETGATHRDSGTNLAGLRDLTSRIAAVCTAENRLLVQREASELVAWAVTSVDSRVVEEALGWAAGLDKPPVLPRALAGTILCKANDSRIPMKPFHPSSGKKSA